MRPVAALAGTVGLPGARRVLKMIAINNWRYVALVTPARVRVKRQATAVLLRRLRLGPADRLTFAGQIIEIVETGGHPPIESPTPARSAQHAAWR